MMPSLLIVHVQSLERAEAADKAARLERCKLGGATDIKPKTRKDPATRAKFIDAGLNPATASKWQLGGPLGGPLGGAIAGEMCGGVPKSDIHKSNNSQSQPTTHGEKGCNDVHFDSIRDKKGFANAADARAGRYCMAKGVTSKKTGITPWRLTRTSGNVDLSASEAV